jgi:hypothetical protein
MTDIGDLMRDARYCASYCEENVWHLLGAAEAAGVPCRAVIVTNPAERVLYFQQRAAPNSYLCWDYHVFARSGNLVLDLDHRDRLPLRQASYARACFPAATEWPEELCPYFLEFAGRQYRQRFASDRRHMRQSEGWLAPPPSWPCIGQGHTLGEMLAEAREHGVPLREWLA